jgi:hypothetical protein
MTNTEQLIANLENCKKNGDFFVDFMVGKNTGNSPSVIPALRNRGYSVTSDSCGKSTIWRLKDKE